MEILRVLNESALYLLIGFALAGVLHVLLGRTEWLTAMLSGTGSRPVWLAAVLGVPLPLCSCSVLPAGMTLYRKGASKGATASFLISVPETDVVSIVITYGLLGPVLAVFRPLAALFTAVVTGQAVNLAERRSGAAADQGEEPSGQERPGDDVCEEECCADEPDYKRPKGAAAQALHYGFIEFFDDILPSLALGIVLGGIITALLPAFQLDELSGGSVLTMLVMLVVGVPMYVCATSSTPIAMGMIAGGVSPGAAMVFLLAGPATNLASVLVLNRYMGRRTLVVYLLCIAVVSVAMGLCLDALIGSGDGLLPGATIPEPESAFTPLKTAASIMLVLLSAASFRRTRPVRRMLDNIAGRTGLPVNRWPFKVGVLLLLVGAYLASGFFIVEPGQRAFVTRFGSITKPYLKPGLHYHWPFPLGGVDIESVREVKCVELGFRRVEAEQGQGWTIQGDESAGGAEESEGRLRGESWMLTGNEDIIDIKWSVHFRVIDTRQAMYAYIYRVSSPRSLVRDAAEAAIRSAVAGRNIDTLLTTARADVEAEVERLLGPALDRCEAGIEVLDVRLLDVHAPSAVHEAFRDVASAAEEKMREKNMAYEYRERVVPQARGDAAAEVLQARGGAEMTIERARGQARAFLDQLAAYRLHPYVTRLRLYFEAVDSCLRRLSKYILPREAGGSGTELWLLGEDLPGPLPFLPGGGTVGNGE